MHTHSVLNELLEREPIFHRPELGTTREKFAAQMHDSFYEIGASGRKYSREQILDTLEARYASPAPFSEHWVIRDAECHELAPDTYLLTYELTLNQRSARRATLWQRSKNDWKICYHQGTLITS